MEQCFQQSIPNGRALHEAFSRRGVTSAKSNALTCAVVKKNLEMVGLELGDIKKVLVHQANAKMDDAILKRLFKLYGGRAVGCDQIGGLRSRT